MSVKNVSLAIVGLIGACLLVGAGVLFLVFPRVSTAPDYKVDVTLSRVARGDYLFNTELACTSCHTLKLSPRRYSGVSDMSKIGAGRHMGGLAEGFPGDINPPNLTPTALHDWTDGEIARAITSGVTRNGRAMFALMPYPYYRHLDPEDVKSLVAYLRSLPPEPITVPATTLILPVRLAMRLVPRDPEPMTRPLPDDKVALGKYLTTVSSCFECHTKRNSKGEPVGAPFAGGNVFPMPNGGISRSANITPDKDTGIGSWTLADFIGRFRANNPLALDANRPGPGDADTEMPWSDFAGMTDSDLAAIYAYLRTVKPVHAEVVTFEAKPEK